MEKRARVSATMFRRPSAAVATSREGQKSPRLPREESSAEQTHPEFFYRSQFHSTVSNLCRLQPARYITTAHSSLCSETMSLRAEGRMALLPVLAKSGPPRTPRRVGTLRDANNFEIQVRLGDGSVGHDALLPTRFPLCIVTSPGPSDRIRRVGALWGAINGDENAR